MLGCCRNSPRPIGIELRYAILRQTASARSAKGIRKMPTPLVMLGPGGDYATRLQAKGTKITRPTAASAQTDPDADARGSLGYHQSPTHTSAQTTTTQRVTKPVQRQPDQFLHTPADTTPGYDASGRSTATPWATAAAAWLHLQTLTLGDLAHDHEQHRRCIASPTPPVTVVAPAKPDLTYIPPHWRRPHHESHPQTAQDPQHDPRDPADPRLFPHHARDRRRIGRLQGHRLRARGSAHQKTGAAPAGQQSPLFGGQPAPGPA